MIDAQSSVLGGTYQRLPGSTTLWQVSILRESHDKGCACSYCREGKVGLVLPACKSHHSWRSIRWKRRGELQVIRWTLPGWWPIKKQP